MAVKLMLALNWLAMVLGAPAALQPEHLPPSVAVQRVSEQKLLGSECTRNSDCKEPKPFCQTKGTNKCTDGMKGAKCADDEECGQGWSCNYIGVNECRPNGLLHDGARCSVDAECSKDPVYLICNTVGVNACRARGEANDRCLDDAECQYGLVCNTVGINRCMKPRTTDEDGAEARCYRDEECEKPYICNKVGIESCRKPAGPGGSCRRDEECAPPTLCNTIGINECRVPDDGRCTRDEECEPGRVCNTHNINRCKKPASKGEHCGRDSECADGLKCQSNISGGVCKKPEDVNLRHRSCDEDKDCHGRLVEGDSSAAHDGKFCAGSTKLAFSGAFGTWLDLGPDGATPKCTCMKVGINSCEVPRATGERCYADKECATGVCNTQEVNRCQDSAETLDAGKRCFSDAMCKGFKNGTMICNAVGVNACRKKGSNGARCRRSIECAEGYHCSSSKIGMAFEQVGIAAALITATALSGGAASELFVAEMAEIAEDLTVGGDLFVTGNEESIVAMNEDISHLVGDWSFEVENDYNGYLQDAMQDDWEDLFVTGNEEIVAMKEDISHLVRDWTLVQNDYNEYLFDAMQDDWEGGHNEAWLDEQQVRMNNYKVQYAIKDDNLKKKIKGLRRQFRSDYCKKHPNKCVKPIPWAAAAAAATATSDEALTKQHQMGSCRKDSHSRLPAAPPP